MNESVASSTAAAESYECYLAERSQLHAQRSQLHAQRAQLSTVRAALKANRERWCSLDIDYVATPQDVQAKDEV